MSYQQVIILGNAGKDPEVRHLDGGKVAATITIATSETFTDRNGNKVEKTEWHSVTSWGKTAEFVEKYVKKGASLLVVGKIRTRSYDSNGVKKYVTEIAAESIQFAGAKKESANQAPSRNEDMPF